MRYARFAIIRKLGEDRSVLSEENTVVEIIEEADGFTIDEMFHPDFVAALEKIGDDVEIGWVKKGNKIQPPTGNDNAE